MPVSTKTLALTEVALSTGKNPMTKTFTIHPRDILLTEFMERVGLPAYRRANELHVSALTNDLVCGKRADTALRLASTSACPLSSGRTCRTSTTSASSNRRPSRSPRSSPAPRSLTPCSQSDRVPHLRHSLNVPKVGFKRHDHLSRQNLLHHFRCTPKAGRSTFNSFVLLDHLSKNKNSTPRTHSPQPTRWRHPHPPSKWTA